VTAVAWKQVASNQTIGSSKEINWSATISYQCRLHAQRLQHFHLQKKPEQSLKLRLE